MNTPLRLHGRDDDQCSEPRRHRRGHDAGNPEPVHANVRPRRLRDGLGRVRTAAAASVAAFATRRSPFLGLDLFGEALIVPVAHGLRHDHPIGFNLFVPFRIGQVVRLRPLLGMCVTPSFFHPEEPGAPRADTILVGAHAGGGLELALHDRLSFFLEAKAVAWFGNDRSVQGWTGAVGGDVRPFLLGQAQLGFTFHLGGA
jgi:hypothetical protein